MTDLQAGIVSMTKEILATQASLTLLTGETLNLSTLTLNLIDFSLGAIVETASTVTLTQPTSITEKVSPPARVVHLRSEAKSLIEMLLLLTS